MSAKNSLTLEIRKKALLVESELNRAHLLNECHEVRDEIQRWTRRAQRMGSVASTTAKLASVAFLIYRRFSRHRIESRQRAENKISGWKSTLKSTLISTALNGARVGFSLLSRLRSRK